MTIPEIDTATALMLVGCGIASITDATTGKILNVLTGPLVLGGLVLNAYLGDWQIGVWGLVLATQIHLPMYFLRIEKGGDVKLLMGIGACMGPAFILNTSFWYACLYLLVGPLVLLYRKRLKNLIVVSKHLAQQAASGVPLDPEAQAPTATILWTAPVIFGAVLAAWWTGYPTDPGLGMILVKILAILYAGVFVVYKLLQWNTARKG
jgi:Flp pilus assembly protein protease CpaA